jgi:hypothetical protein
MLQLKLNCYWFCSYKLTITKKHDPSTQHRKHGCHMGKVAQIKIRVTFLRKCILVNNGENEITLEYFYSSTNAV